MVRSELVGLCVGEKENSAMLYAPLHSAQEVQLGLSGLNGWSLEGDSIVKRFRFRNFQASLEFVNRVGGLAEAADHHPDIIINYNRVTLSLTTHASKGLTHRDFDLAKEIDGAGVVPRVGSG